MKAENHEYILAEAIRQCAVSCGIINPDAAPTGPELLMVLEDIADHFQKSLKTPQQSDLRNLRNIDIVRDRGAVPSAEKREERKT